VSLDEAISPLWDAAPDWSHADGRAATAMRSIVAAHIEAATATVLPPQGEDTTSLSLGEAREPPAASGRAPWPTRRRGGHAWRRGGAKGRGPKPNAFC